MLIEFSVKNYRSYKAEQSLNLVASSDDSLPDNCSKTKDFKLLNSAAIYGPNASGKSNLIKAIKILQGGLLASYKSEPNAGIPVSPFGLDRKLSKEPCSFEITFICDKVRYQYGFTSTRKRIHDEWLYAYPLKRPQLWYQRTFDAKTSKTDWKFSDKLKGEKEKLKGRTRDNALFLSTAAQWNHTQLTKIFNWFGNLRFIGSGSTIKPVTLEMLLSSQKKGISSFKNTLISILQDADLGISNIDVKELDLEKLEFPSDMPEDIRNEVRQSLLPESIYFHHKNTSGESFILPFKDESDGTRRFFELVGPVFDVLKNGYTLFIDEIETSMHPLLIRTLISIFHDPKTNKKGAQLIFTTHNTTLLDSELFRRDQIWFTEKDKHGATALYSLYDYKEHRPRKGEAMQKGYLSGRYGAIPFIEPFHIK